EAQRDFEQFIQNGPIVRQQGRLIMRQPTFDPSLLFHTNASILLVADQIGRVAGIDRNSGQVLWRLLCPFDKLENVAISEEVVARAGIGGINTDAEAGEMLVLDPLTGERLLPVIHSSEKVAWVGLGPDGLLLQTTESQAVAYQLRDGLVAWRLSLPVEALHA